MLSIPASENDFTPDWINEALDAHLEGHEVIAVEARFSQTPGQTAEIVHLQLSFNAMPPVPERMVAKITSHDAMIRELVGLFGQYAREVTFYREFPDVGIPIPDCYHCAHDPGRQEMIILMRDLAPAVSPSWAIDPAQVELAVEHLPPFHARWWNDETLLDKDWLVQRGDTDFYYAAAGAAAGAEESIRSLFGHDADYTVETVKLARDKVDTVLAFMQSRPFTLVHGDYHGKQMFFPSRQGGQFAVIDWQYPFVAQGSWDLTRIISLGLETEQRARLQERLFSNYYRELGKHGVTGYSRDEFDLDIKLGSWISQNIMAIAAADTDPGIMEAECNALGVDWREVLLLRGDLMLQELNLLDFLEHL